jgi:4,5-DOPA dioxygenase extradiol
MIYDFYGFPPELYGVQYPAPGNPALAQEVAALLAKEGLDVEPDTARGLDHGIWVPLSLMYPDAAVPVVRLSVQPQRGAAHHFAVGRALRRLRGDNVLILASGGATHNLRLLSTLHPDEPPPARTAVFEEWLCQSIRQGRVEDLVHYEERAPEVRWNHPTTEHLMPLFVALGAASDGAAGRILHRRFEYGALSMAAFAWQ